MGIERRRAGAGKGGRIAAAADKGEIGFGQGGEAVGEQAGVAATPQEGEIGLCQHLVLRAQIGEEAGGARIGEDGADIAEARATEDRTRRTRTDSEWILAAEARSSGSANEQAVDSGQRPQQRK